MINANEAKDLVKTYEAQELKKQTIINWLEANVELKIRTAAAKGKTQIIVTVPGELYSLIRKVLEELGYEVSHVYGCQLQIRWEN